jgi:hypothetical protein
MKNDARRHPAIEAFLATVEGKLRGLAPEARADERNELAQHLDLLAAAYQARGLDEAGAAAAALERFGHAERIGRDLHRASRCGDRPSPLDYLRFFLGYGGFIVVAYLALFWSMGDPMPRGLPWAIAANALLLPSAFIYSDMKKRRKAATARD